MKSTTYIAEITNQKIQKYLCEEKSNCLFPRLLASCQLINFPCAPIFLGIFFYHSFYCKILVKSRRGGKFFSLASSVNVWEKHFFSVES